MISRWRCGVVEDVAPLVADIGADAAALRRPALGQVGIEQAFGASAVGVVQRHRRPTRWGENGASIPIIG
jgi:hypothetical protein